MNTYLKVSDIVGQMLFEMGEQTTHLTERALYHALQMVKDCALDGKLNYTKPVVLPVERNIRTVRLPSDFVDTVRVVVMKDAGPVEVPRSDRKSVRLGTLQQPVGQGLSTQGYVLDTDKAVILLPSEESATEIMLEYISTGLNPTGETTVHPYLEKPLLAYVYWKLIEKRRDYSRADKAEAKLDFKKAKGEAYARSERFTAGEFLSATRAGYGTILKG